MMAPFRRAHKAALAALALSAAAAVEAQGEPAPDARPALAVMGTIPLYWGEAADLGEIIGGNYRGHWARAQLEREWQLAPLDFLGEAELAGHARLLLAQPRGLAPEENLVLDRWVRAGGQLLLLADPMMTGESRFGLGDRRRPQDVALLSPILAHWGLELHFDDGQPGGMAMREIAGRGVPVNLPGRFVLAEGGAAACALGGEGVLARCTLERGRLVLLADAALLDLAGPWPGAPEALAALAGMAFGTGGEFAGPFAGRTPVDPADDAIEPILSQTSQAGELRSP